MPRTPRFSRFACIDWSGANTRWHSGIAVALCEAGSEAPMLVAPPSKHWTRAAVLDWLRAQAVAGDDVLVGLDLSFALPFLDCGSYFPGWQESPDDARALWQLVETLCAGDEALGATGFLAHGEIARHFRQHRALGDLFGSGRGRLRRCERDGQALIPGINPYSCFNLVGAAQVGKSSLTGMRVLHRLEQAIPVWPFDSVPTHGPVIVEIYTSIAARATAVLPMGKSKITDARTLDAALAAFGSCTHRPLQSGYSDHATDAMVTAAWIRAVAEQPAFWQPGLMDTEIAQTEGWTFGVL